MNTMIKIAGFALKTNMHNWNVNQYWHKEIKEVYLRILVTSLKPQSKDETNYTISTIPTNQKTCICTKWSLR